MDELEKCYKVMPQSSTKGIRAVEIAKKLGVHKTTVYRHLTSLELLGKVENRNGMWYVKTGEQTIKPLEKEIVRELPMPRNQWHRMATVEAQAKELESVGLQDIAESVRIFVERFRETRIIRITGKNVDNLDLEKLGNLIKQANQKSSKVNLRGLFKSLKRSRSNNSQRE